MSGDIKDRKSKRTPQKSLTVAIIGLLAFLYLVNPGFGVFEFIPDNIPIIGNLDEVGATFLLLSSLAYFGIDLRDFFRRPN